jgi:hypothetical protein
MTLHLLNQQRLQAISELEVKYETAEKEAPWDWQGEESQKGFDALGRRVTVMIRKEQGKPGLRTVDMTAFPMG